MVVCPDKFAGTMTAEQAAQAIADGWRTGDPSATLTVLPQADGGPGFLDAVEAGVGGRLVAVATVDPFGRPVTAGVLLVGDTAYIESAQACGRGLLDAGELDPLRASSYGVGLLLAAAVETGARTVVVGLGGSATNDGGAGALAALGAAPVDRAGLTLPYGALALRDVVGLNARPRLRPVNLVAAVDVVNPLTGPAGATAVYGPQKGLGPAQAPVLDDALTRYAQALRQLPGAPADLAARPGGGAAGGLGAALLALGARVESGATLVRTLTGLDDAVSFADLVVTGEGSLDQQSASGKVVSGVAAAARAAGVPCLALAGRVSLGATGLDALGLVAAYGLVDEPGGPDQAMIRPGPALRALAARVATGWAGVGNGQTSASVGWIKQRR
ncbi:glycerate kinase [Pilimelia columellifera]|uniref:Glycerate kinase n=1 Tax=Pilimelia columellifera subsp. columellifera TaxID=706583 RepID=A0ABP6AZ42_9ACTN